MVIEIAQFRAREGKRQELEDGLLRGLTVIRRAEGCLDAQLRRCVEDAEMFIYEIQWQTLEHHTVRFRGGPGFAEYRSHISGLFVEPVSVNHYETVAS